MTSTLSTPLSTVAGRWWCPRSAPAVHFFCCRYHSTLRASLQLATEALSGLQIHQASRSGANMFVRPVSSRVPAPRSIRMHLFQRHPISTLRNNPHIVWPTLIPLTLQTPLTSTVRPHPRAPAPRPLLPPDRPRKPLALNRHRPRPEPRANNRLIDPKPILPPNPPLRPAHPRDLRPSDPSRSTSLRKRSHGLDRRSEPREPDVCAPTSEPRSGPAARRLDPCL